MPTTDPVQRIVSAVRSLLGGLGARLGRRARERPRELVVNAVLMAAIVLLATDVLRTSYAGLLAAACLVLIHREQRLSVARANPRTPSSEGPAEQE